MGTNKHLICFIVLVLVSGCVSVAEKPSEEKAGDHSEQEAEQDQNKEKQIPLIQQPSAETEKQEQQATDLYAEIPPCGDTQEFFTVSPLKETDFHGIVPIGTISPTGHTFPSQHLYFHVRRSDPSNFDSVPVEVPVVAPGDFWITEISLVEYLTKPDFSDSFMAFYPCKEFKAYFDHVKKLSPKIMKAFDEAKAKRCDEYFQIYPEYGKLDIKKCDKDVKIFVEKGEQIGTAGGGKGQMVFDFGAIDYRNKPHYYVNPERLRFRQDMLWIACGLDYFSEEEKQKLKARLGDSTGSIKRTHAPICGKIDYDVDETAQGIWFAKGIEYLGHEAPHLALVPDHIYSDKRVFSIGTTMEEKGFRFGRYFFSPRESGFVNRDFDEVKQGSVYCYETVGDFGDKSNFIILIELVSPAKTRIEKQEKTGCGTGTWSFTEKFTEFDR